ncbi:pyrroloquinoline quinone biosynthesis protein PqqB [Kribbella sp. NPDC051770]|uniref:pyrroloquinoline quinone biosynthesis protein PqqB n=1 Tax=Kribbella sp. NPDC051770 TaxID=3155413 RepID=UPI00341FB399
MKVLLLGTAAGGGFPQWNCACPTCADPTLPPRTQDGLAISADGAGWYLVNASPDIRSQILAAPELRAGPGPRDTPIRGVLLTDAELDHTLGLLMLREGAGLEVHAPPAVQTALRDDFPVRGIVERYGSWSWPTVGIHQQIGGLNVRALPVSDKRPKYANGGAGPWVVAYRFEDPRTGGVLVYAPCLASLPPEFEEFVDGATTVILDGTFYDAQEMTGRTQADSQAQVVMGHVPIATSLEHLRKLSALQPGTSWVYTHLNNTNPVLDPRSSQHRGVRAAGVKVLPDQTALEL